ncbi:uncharacterized protein LOC143445086 [Clavelina lepadiformis]|uniref:Biogenesis of lysosome-related organelles complex 1 subunit 3 n=1 Tax=Clavelina lepadiformis TaxID=159417 RepID=A0ABP0F9U4_CLALP
MSENNQVDHKAHGIVVLGEDSESDIEEAMEATNGYLNVESSGAGVNQLSVDDDILSQPEVEERETVLNPDLAKNEGITPPSYNSLLHKKLQEANIKLWMSVGEVQSNTSRDVVSTMKRVCGRLDKTQALAVDNSNKIRSSIDNLRILSSTVRAVLSHSKTALPQFIEAQTTTTL